MMFANTKKLGNFSNGLIRAMTANKPKIAPEDPIRGYERGIPKRSLPIESKKTAVNPEETYIDKKSFLPITLSRTKPKLSNIIQLNKR